MLTAHGCSRTSPPTLVRSRLERLASETASLRLASLRSSPFRLLTLTKRLCPRSFRVFDRVFESLPNAYEKCRLFLSAPGQYLFVAPNWRSKESAYGHALALPPLNEGSQESPNPRSLGNHFPSSALLAEHINPFVPRAFRVRVQYVYQLLRSSLSDKYWDLRIFLASLLFEVAGINRTQDSH